MYRDSAPADLQMARRIIRCIQRPQTSLEKKASTIEFLVGIKAVCATYLDGIGAQIGGARTREQDRLIRTRREVMKAYRYFDSLSRGSPRYLPIRGQNTIRSRGALRTESRTALQVRMLPRMQGVFTVPVPVPVFFMEPMASRFEHFYDDYGAHTLRLAFKSLQDYRPQRDSVLLFDVLYEDGSHVLSGMLFPAIGEFPRRLVYINTWFFDQDVTGINALYATNLDDLGITDQIRTTVLPDDIGMNPRLRATIVSNDPDLESRIPRLTPLQSLDVECRGVGQCQHWSFMTAYVFLKEYAALIRSDLVGEAHFKNMCIRVWRTLEQAEPPAGFNALQREMELLGGF